MIQDNIIPIVSLLVLGSALAGMALVRMRPGVVRSLQNAVTWVLIFVGMIAAAGMWQDIRDTLPIQTVQQGGGQITTPLARDGHYYLTLDVNGVATRFVVDTGATDIVLTKTAASRAGIDLDGLHYLGRAMTANGAVQTARVRLNSVTLGGITDRNITASINGGALHESLLGMRYLQRFAHIEISGNKMVLTR